MSEWNAGEVGGIFAGVVAAVAAVGKGLAWLLDWNETRSSGREARLAAWEKNLADREKAYRHEIEEQLAATQAELARVKGELDVVRVVLGTVTTELHRHAPRSPALAQAARTLGRD